MTPDDLRILLRRLADLTGTLLDDLDDSALPAASYSGNEGAAPKGGKSKPPVPIADLDYIVTDVEPRIRGWCQNLAATAHLTGYPAGARVNILVAWLSRNRAAILNAPWAEDAITELADLEEELRARLYPIPPEKVAAMGAIARDRKGPASEIARLLTALTGKRVDRRKVSYLAQSGRINEYTGPGDTSHFSLREAREALEEWQDGRMKSAQ